MSNRKKRRKNNSQDHTPKEVQMIPQNKDSDIGQDRSTFRDMEESNSEDITVESAFISSEELRVEQETMDGSNSSSEVAIVLREVSSASISRSAVNKKARNRNNYDLKTSAIRRAPLWSTPAVIALCAIFGVLAAFLYYANVSRAEQAKKQLQIQEALIEQQKVNQQKVCSERENLEKKYQTLEGSEKASRAMVLQMQDKLQQMASNLDLIQEENKFLDSIERSGYFFRAVSAVDGFPEAIMYTSEETGTVMLCLVLEKRPTQFRPFIQRDLRMIAIRGNDKEELIERINVRKKLDFKKLLELLNREVKKDKKLQPYMDEASTMAKKIFMGADEKVSSREKVSVYSLYEADRAMQKKTLNALGFFGEDALILFTYLAIYNKALKRLEKAPK